MIILIGRPASGKSTFCQNYLIGYERVNRDSLKTMPKCEKAARQFLEKGISVVIDNTNPSTDSRANFISIAKELKVPCRCFNLKKTIDKELNEHLNLFRERLVDVRRIPDVAYRSFDSKYEEPTKNEGFSEIYDINFVPKFKSEKDKELFFLRT